VLDWEAPVQFGLRQEFWAAARLGVADAAAAACSRSTDRSRFLVLARALAGWWIGEAASGGRPVRLGPAQRPEVGLAVPVFYLACCAALQSGCKAWRRPVEGRPSINSPSRQLLTLAAPARQRAAWEGCLHGCLAGLLGYLTWARAGRLKP